MHSEEHIRIHRTRQLRRDGPKKMDDKETKISKAVVWFAAAKSYGQGVG